MRLKHSSAPIIFDKSLLYQVAAAVVVAVVIVASFIWQGKIALKEQGIAEAREYAVKVEREKATQEAKIAQEAKAAQEQKEYERLPTEAKARIQFGKVIEGAYKGDGRLISVHATGKDFDTLELSSGLIAEGSHTLDAAREIMGPDTVQMMKGLKFKRVAIRGISQYFEGYSLE
jgi:hypothetical protein